MILKQREESLELKIMRFLRSRMHLSAEDELYCYNLEKGYEGELKFDERLEELLPGRLALNDLLLEHRNTLFQNDSLLLSSGKNYLFEVKNFEGDFYVDGDRWCSTGGTEIKNPLFQLKRNESLLRQLLKALGCNMPVEAYLVFINPEFHLSQAPLDSQIIFPAQLNRFLDKIKKQPSNVKNAYSALAEQLLSLHVTDPPNFRLPEYQYDELKKGIYCPKCFRFYEQQNTRLYLFCKRCVEKEDYETAVLRTVKEFKLLFPEEKITTNRMYEWCFGIYSKQTMRKILHNNYKLNGHGKYSYFDE
ncbi:nuclease-related domain-containing protein [Bacillus sp. Marseille-Q3570]|uniref:nuclease-related domain-containing protein n=1 Tax=Bacillus sp. Marseille-Q3570 TaxID=2963522 RepID=UPI0021B6FD04|nr:nuclease-related domain-containing protein [Bacillus sp. Marseille-Q3570]